MTDTPNKRMKPRFEFAGEVFVESFSLADGSSLILRCKASDASENGLKVETEAELTEGAFLRIGVEAPGRQEPLYLVGEVKWSKVVDATNNRYFAGFRFVNDDGHDLKEWQALITRFTENAAPGEDV
jgi:hypothetical protein